MKIPFMLSASHIVSPKPTQITPKHFQIYPNFTLIKVTDQQLQKTPIPKKKKEKKKQ